MLFNLHCGFCSIRDNCHIHLVPIIWRTLFSLIFREVCPNDLVKVILKAFCLAVLGGLLEHFLLESFYVRNVRDKNSAPWNTDVCFLTLPSQRDSLWLNFANFSKCFPNFSSACESIEVQFRSSASNFMAPAKMLKLRPFIVSNLSRTLESNFRLWSVNAIDSMDSIGMFRTLVITIGIQLLLGILLGSLT